MTGTRKPALAVILAAAIAPQGAPAGEPEAGQLLRESRAIVQAFGKRLKGELMKGMEEGGPPGAIRVCSDIAPAIASELSREHGARVGRTSLKLRNPVNAPTPWQTRTLKRWQREVEEGAEVAGLEHYRAINRAGTRFRYMKSIPAGGLCLSCHGDALAPEVEGALDEQYPHDRARGYQAGELRGAFTVVWPEMPEEE